MRAVNNLAMYHVNVFCTLLHNGEIVGPATLVVHRSFQFGTRLMFCPGCS